MEESFEYENEDSEFNPDGVSEEIKSEIPSKDDTEEAE